MNTATLILNAIAVTISSIALILLVVATRYSYKTMHYAKSQLGEMATTRQTALVSEKVAQWYSPEMDQAKLLIYEGSAAGQIPDDYWYYLNRFQKSTVLSISRFFESLDILVELEALDVSKVLKYFGSEALFYWDKLSGVVTQERERRGKHLYSRFEHLVSLAQSNGMTAQSSAYWQL